jgi:TIR domain
VVKRVEESEGRRLVFISHSGVDTWVAKQIAREIERCGAQPFLDEADIHAGADFEEEILTFLQRTHEFVTDPMGARPPVRLGRNGSRLGKADSHRRIVTRHVGY